MVRIQNLASLPITAIGVVLASLQGLPSYAESPAIGEKGADVYCFLRGNGNSHEVSWDAAYQIIKRQKSSVFKTSPKHGAVMITETVVQNPNKYKGCGNYLGDLFSPPNSNVTKKVNATEEDFPSQSNKIPSEIKKGDRYSY